LIGFTKSKAPVNKSEEIRKVFTDNPGAMAKEVVATLKEQGIDVSEALVYAAKKTLKPGKKAAAVKTTQKAVAPSSNGVLSVGASITNVKGLAGKVGGLKALKEIVDALQ
jgi:hypothetical protein